MFKVAKNLVKVKMFFAISRHKVSQFIKLMSVNSIVCIGISTPLKTPPPLFCQPPVKPAKCPSSPF